MDLDLLVIGDTFAGWQEGVLAALMGRRVGLVALPASPDLPEWDLRQFPEEILKSACSEWALSMPSGSVRSHALPRQWDEFRTLAREFWRRDVQLLREQLLSAKGRVWTGNVMFTGAHTSVVACAGSPPFLVRSDQTLIATGTRPVPPRFAVRPVSGASDACRLLEANSLPGAASVVGAGVTGLRAACLLAWWGTEVTVVDGRGGRDELEDDETFGLWNWAEKLAVSFQLSEDVIGLRSQGGKQRVVLTLESGRQLSTESVWLATGRRGRTDELKLEHARLSVDDTGRLWCGPRLRTWIPSILAAGDVVGYSPTAERDEEAVPISRVDYDSLTAADRRVLASVG